MSTTLRECRIQFPEKVVPVLFGKGRLKVLHGGRGGAKSWAFARYLVIRAAREKLRILCAREIQNSIKDSVYRLLVDQIYALGLQAHFIIRADSIIGRHTGAEFIFKGLRQNISEVKSLEGIDICWVEEAEKVSLNSWDILTPTIRKENSEIIVSFNPEDENSATDQMFLGKNGPPPDTLIAELNYPDNPWFPEVLRKEMEYCRRVDPDKYNHVWLGKTKKYGEACIFASKVFVEAFDDPTEDQQMYYGMDFGFSAAPTSLHAYFIKDNKLYVWQEAYGHGVEITELPAFVRSVPGTDKWKIRADSERPDTISYLRNEGFDIQGAEKGKGSVEDGIQFIRSFEAIVIHPRCRGALDDYRNYRWKQDKSTNEVLPIPLDKSNHACDDGRYALEPYIKNKVSAWDVI